jgi:hypothetical protein
MARLWEQVEKKSLVDEAELNPNGMNTLSENGMVLGGGLEESYGLVFSQCGSIFLVNGSCGVSFADKEIQ